MAAKKRSAKKSKKSKTSLTIEAKDIRISGEVEEADARRMLRKLKRHRNPLIRAVGVALTDVLDSVAKGGR